MWKNITFFSSDCIDFGRIAPEMNVLYVERGTCVIDPRKKYLKIVKRPDGTDGVRFYIIEDPKRFW